MSVSLPCSPSFSRSIRCGRLTTFGRSRGIYSFVARMGVGMPYVPGLCDLPVSALLYFPARKNRYKERRDAFKSSYVRGLHPFLYEASRCLLPCSYSPQLFIILLLN